MRMVKKYFLFLEICIIIEKPYRLRIYYTKFAEKEKVFRGL
jgi:hypothetical protein